MILTVGHSNLAIGDFLALLAAHRVGLLVDIRRYPSSRRLPWFNRPLLAEALAGAGIRYQFAGDGLGGMREVDQADGHDALSGPLRGYAAHMQGEAFRRAVGELLETSRSARLAVMCAERDPANCHRSLLADYLELAGTEVRHLVDAGSDRRHQRHPSARRHGDGVVYDGHVQQRLC